MNSPGANDSMMNRPHLPVRERLAGANAASIADSFVPLKASSFARSLAYARLAENLTRVNYTRGSRVPSGLSNLNI